MKEFILEEAKELASGYGKKIKRSDIEEAFVLGALFNLSFLHQVMEPEMSEMYNLRDYRGMFTLYQKNVSNIREELKFPVQIPAEPAGEDYDLFLILTAEWFKKHHTGGKKIEYRAITEYWRKRLYTADGTPKAFRTVTFQLGYAKNAPRITKSFEGLDAGFPVVQWVPEGCERKQYFRIHCGDIFAAVNC